MSMRAMDSVLGLGRFAGSIASRCKSKSAFESGNSHISRLTKGPRLPRREVDQADPRFEEPDFRPLVEHSEGRAVRGKGGHERHSAGEQLASEASILARAEIHFVQP
jgi:hypothetical protein